MTQEGFKRKLTSIFSADAVGYSRLMGDDEAATVQTLTSYRNVISTLIKQHNGTVIDSPGDNLLAEFVSVVDAVQCAVAVQKELNARNDKLPEDRRMPFRIGINLGDVIQEDDRIYGDGVNIAARLEGLAEPGGICISKTTFEQIESKLPYGYNYIGDQTVKNISKPVGVYRILLDSRVMVEGKPAEQKPASKKRRAIIIGICAIFALVIAFAIWQFYFTPFPQQQIAATQNASVPEIPEKPSIAVLPFENLSGDPKQEYFSRGITEEIITGLSKIKRLYVVASHSTLIYKDKAVDVRQVGNDLGVRYVLEGNVRKDGERVRITAQLLDANTGHHVWVESYDRNYKDIFALQDDVTMKIMKAMRVQLTQGEQAQLWGRYDTENPEVYEKHIKAHYHLLRGTPEDNIIARQLWEETIKLDSNFAVGYMKLGFTYFFDVLYGCESPAASIKKSFEYAYKALSVDDSIELAHSLLAQLYLLTEQYEKALAEAKRGVDLNPNGSDALLSLASVYKESGMAEEAIPICLKAIRLNPTPSVFLFHILGQSYFFSGRYEEAIEVYKKALQINPSYFYSRVALAAAYGISNRDKEAQITVKEILEIYPKFSVEGYAKDIKNKDQAYIDKSISGMRKAGLPD